MTYLYINIIMIYFAFYFNEIILLEYELDCVESVMHASKYFKHIGDSI